jgi:putative transposase
MEYRFFQLGLKSIEKKWTMPIRDWKGALQQFVIVFEGRMPLP